LYAMESAVLRAEKAGGALHQDLACLFVHEALDRMEITARNALAAIESGDTLQVQLSLVRRLLRREPVNRVVLGRRVAAAVLEAGGYPLSAR
ncbi:MAG TPA: acyl-CoA dehydrogenase, partial [Thermaerobacter sp.]